MRRWALLACLVLVADQLMKFFAVQRLPSDGGRLRSIVDFALHKNYGIAFDLPIPSWIVIPFTLLIIVGAAVALYRFQRDTRITSALVFIILGGIGNLIDRVAYAFTVDYIILFGRSAINLSDLMILGGVIALIVGTRQREHAR